MTLCAILFALAVPIFLITTNVMQVTNDPAFYEREFQRYQVSRTTALTQAQLREVALAFIEFFAGRGDALTLRLEVSGASRPLFSDRELAHMGDVLVLMQAVRWLQISSGVTMLLSATLGFMFWRAAFARRFALACFGGGAITLALLVGVGALALLDFGDAFLQFHLIAFSNDLWMLDPTRDYLLMLFPEGFWFDATTQIATLSAVEALAILMVGGVLIIFRRKL